MWFKGKRRTDGEYNWSDEPGYDDWETPSRNSRHPTILLALILLLLATAVAAGAFWLVQRRTPTYAAEKWFDAMFAANGYRVMELTCDEEIWVSNVVNGGSVVQGFLEFLGITSIPGLDILGVAPDLQDLSKEIEVDRSQVEFTEVQQSNDSAVVAVNGRLRIRAFGGWFPYRLDEEWLMVREDGQWRWCGRRP